MSDELTVQVKIKHENPISGETEMQQILRVDSETPAISSYFDLTADVSQVIVSGASNFRYAYIFNATDSAVNNSISIFNSSVSEAIVSLDFDAAEGDRDFAFIPLPAMAEVRALSTSNSSIVVKLFK